MTEAQPRRGRPPGADGVETRRRILRGARTVFSGTGFDRATMEQIAREAGITRNAIANYYPNKAEIYQAAFDSVQREAFAAITRELPGPERPAVERIYALFEVSIRFNERDSTFVRFWVTGTLDAARHSGLSDRPRRYFAQVSDYLAGCIEQGVRTGEMTAEVVPEDLTQLLVDLLWGLAMDCGFHSPPERVHQVLRPLRLLLAGAVARGDDP